MRVLESEPLAGFRIWRIVDGLLWSPYVPTVWTERLARAECYRGPGALIELSAGADHATDTAPDRNCRCGIHAYLAPPSRFSTVDHRGVTGVVTVWGRIEPRADGVRAEHARVEALGVSLGWTDRQRWAVFEVAERLEVDLVSARSFGRGSRCPPAN